MKKLINKCYNISSISIVAIVALVLFSIMLIASVNNSNDQKTIVKEEPPYWIPTKEDIAYQDSMFQIIIETTQDVDTIKESIDHIIYKLDKIVYEDGTSDSIRVQIEPTKENQSR